MCKKMNVTKCANEMNEKIKGTGNTKSNVYCSWKEERGGGVKVSQQAIRRAYSLLWTVTLPRDWLDSRTI